MTPSWFQQTIEWSAANPTAALVLVVICAAIEGFLIIGLFIPGTLLMFGIGALVALGAVDFSAALIAAAGGAVLGDGLSYLIGRRTREELPNLRLVQKYPSVLSAANKFVDTHGGKSVLMGRFIGPMRPLVPAVVGAAGMHPGRYCIATVPAAFIWAAVYMIPGLLFGASMGMAAEVGSRLVIVLVAVFVLIWLVYLLVRAVVMLIAKYAEPTIDRLLNWSDRHRHVGVVGQALVNPDQPETRGLAILAVALYLISAIIMASIWGLTGERSPTEFDAIWFQWMQELQTPWVLDAAVAVAQTGDWRVYTPVALAVLVSLVVTRRMLAATHWMAAIGFGALVAVGFHWLLNIPSPLAYFRAVDLAAPYGGHVILSTIVFGFAPVLMSIGKSARRTIFNYAFCYSIVVLTAAARVFIGAQWLSAALLGMVVGLVWVGILSLAFRRHSDRAAPIKTARFLPIVLGVFFVATLLNWRANHQDMVHLLKIESPAPGSLTAQQWQSSGYTLIPAFRLTALMQPASPVNVQWVGEISDIRSQLLQQGWTLVAKTGWLDSARWLARETPIADLPVLPQQQAGYAPALVMRQYKDESHQWILRLWPTQWQIQSEINQAAPVTQLWMGTVSYQRVRDVASVLRFPETTGEYQQALQHLGSQLGDIVDVLQHPAAEAVPGMVWEGQVLLIQTPQTVKPALGYAPSQVVKPSAQSPSEPNVRQGETSATATPESQDFAK